jgi:predicted nucleic acid-binding protein
MSVLVDTNLLLRSIQTDHAHYPMATSALLLLRRTERLCITTQNLYELWSVCTRPAAVNGMGMSTTDAKTELDKARRFFTLLPDAPAIFNEWERLVTTHDVKGKNAHDARLVAAMIVQGIEKILTFNKKDFLRFSQIQVLTPDEILSSRSS